MTTFRSATVKLTGWYLVVLMTVTISFSVVIYTISSRELDRPLPPSSQVSQLFEQLDDFRAQREARANEGKRSLIINLILLNTVTLALGAGASYVFARRTLKPIEESMEAQSRFVSDASHELRTPLAVMRTEGEIALREKKPSISDLKAAIVSNLEEVNRLQSLTDRLLALSSQQTVESVPFSIDDAIQAAVARHSQAVKRKHMLLKVKSSSARVMGDVDSIGDVIAILIDNAIKYSPDKTTIEVRVIEQSKKIVVSVIDEGPGIKSDEAAKIFDRFYRSDQSRSKQRVEGHGLGLALARRLSSLSHAQLAVNVKRSKGSQFDVTLEKA